MQLDLADPLLLAKLTRLPGSLRRPTRMRLVVEYPDDPEYRDRVLGALGDMLRPREYQSDRHQET